MKPVAEPGTEETGQLAAESRPGGFGAREMLGRFHPVPHPSLLCDFILVLPRLPFIKLEAPKCQRWSLSLIVLLLWVLETRTGQNEGVDDCPDLGERTPP